MKALNNMVVFMTANALAEAITIGRRAGMDAKLLFETMSKGSSDSAVLRTHGAQAPRAGAISPRTPSRPTMR